jgi:purine-nucleoside phosphorylase
MQEAVAFIRTVTQAAPKIGIVLGSGLGDFARELQDAVEIPYADIPGWPPSTAIGHAGRLMFGKLDGLEIAVMAGRNHLYEGYSAAQAAYGVRVLFGLGVRSMVFTNAAGGINLDYQKGALVLISDHINLQGANPLTGPNDDTLGPRFPDMTEAYSTEYRAIAHAVARELGFVFPEGVYAALAGPSYETPAEIRYLRAIGADLVGMSTVPEVIMANYLCMRVLAISCVTNMAAGVLPQKLNHEEVMEVGRQVRGTLVRLLKAILPRL